MFTEMSSFTAGIEITRTGVSCVTVYSFNLTGFFLNDYFFRPVGKTT